MYVGDGLVHEALFNFLGKFKNTSLLWLEVFPRCCQKLHQRRFAPEINLFSVFLRVRTDTSPAAHARHCVGLLPPTAAAAVAERAAAMSADRTRALAKADRVRRLRMERDDHTQCMHHSTCPSRARVGVPGACAIIVDFLRVHFAFASDGGSVQHRWMCWQHLTRTERILLKWRLAAELGTYVNQHVVFYSFVGRS